MGQDFLQSLMISPTQRLARYPLLLKEVIHYSLEVHQDYNDLQKAFKLYTEMGEPKNVNIFFLRQNSFFKAQHVNEAKKSSDQMWRKVTLQSESSMVIKTTHELETFSSSAVKTCGSCQKAIWGVARKHFKCLKCKGKFHLECRSKKKKKKKKKKRQKERNFTFFCSTELLRCVVIIASLNLRSIWPTRTLLRSMISSFLLEKIVE